MLNKQNCTQFYSHIKSSI